MAVVHSATYLQKAIEKGVKPTTIRQKLERRIATLRGLDDLDGRSYAGGLLAHKFRRASYYVSHPITPPV